MLEWSEEENRYMAMHHPFTMPMEEDWDKIDSAPGEVRAKAYDIVLNGTELGGGSVRIHRNDIQEKMFEVLGFTKEKAWENFGFLMSEAPDVVEQKQLEELGIALREGLQ